MLQVKSLYAGYKNIQALKGVECEVRDGEIVTLVGANGSGKSTLLKTLMGKLRNQEGAVEFLGARIDKDPPHARVKKGLVLVPEGRAILTSMTVHENLLLGGYARKDQRALRQEAQSILGRFPLLATRQDSPARVLSGGEQQMLTIARALMARPRLLMVDEPSLGLAPLIVREVFDILSELRDQGITVLLVEQNAMQALKLADRGYVMEQGRIMAHDAAEVLLRDLEALERAYFGGKEI